MADPQEIRRVLRENGHEMPARGRISKDDQAEFERITAANGMADDAGFIGADDDAGEPVTETPPSRPAAARSFSMPKRKAPAKKKRKRVHARVPVDRIIERGWEMFARLAKPVDLPLARTLSMQAPVAGLVLEDVVRDTVVDKVLQPVARYEEKAEKVLALVGPPLLVAAIEAAQGLPEEQREVRMAFLEPLLTESLTIWCKVAGDKIEAKMKRDEEEGPVREQVEMMLKQIFAPVVPAEAAA